MSNRAEWDYKKTVQSIIQMKQDESLKLNDFPESLTFHPESKPIRHTIGVAIDEVWDKTEADADHHEHGRGFIIPYIRPNILFPSEVVRGLSDEVKIKAPLGRNPFNHWQRDTCAFTVHSHGYTDVPFSMQDFFCVLANPSLYSGATVGMMVLTRTLQMIAFRSDKTPSLDPAVVELVVADMKQTFADKISMKSAPVSEKEHTQIRMNHIIEQCQRFSFALFASLRQDPILRRVRY